MDRTVWIRTIIGRLYVALIATIVATVLGATVLAADQAGESDYQAISRLFDSLAYDDILSQYRNVDWSVKDPGALMIYCATLVESGAPIPETLKRPKAKRHVAMFAEAYISLLNGKIDSSERIFLELTDDVLNDARLLGHIGLLEQAALTQNIPLTREQLKKVRVLAAKGGAPDWVVPAYELSYFHSVGKTKEAVRVLETIKERSRQLVPGEIAIFAELLMRQDRLKEAGATLRQGLDQNRDSQELINAYANWLLISKGPSESVKYLKERAGASPKMWKVQLGYATHLLYTGERGDRELALRIIENVAARRLHDVPVRLFAINTVLEQGAQERAGQMVNNLDRAAETLDRFLAYRRVLARIDSLAGHEKSMYRNLDRANELNEMDLELNWLTYELASRWGDTARARDALQKLQQVDPNNVYVLGILAREANKRQLKREAAAFARRALNSKRYVPSDMRSELQQYF